MLHLHLHLCRHRASGVVADDASTISGSTTLTSTTTTTGIQLPTRRSSVSGEMLRSDVSLSLQKRATRWEGQGESEADSKPDWQKGIQPRAAGEQARLGVGFHHWMLSSTSPYSNPPAHVSYRPCSLVLHRPARGP